jgi:hypothetical protein
VAIAEEAAVDLTVVIGGRWLGDQVLEAGPGAVLLPDVIDWLDDVGEPADLAFGVGELERREAHEDAGEQEIDQ